MSASKMSSRETPGQRVYPARITITQISATRFRLPFRSPFRTSRGTIIKRDGMILRLVTDAGVIGVGEASPHPALGSMALSNVENALERVAPRVVGTTLSAGARTAAQCTAECIMASEPYDDVTVDAWMDGLRMEIPPALACALDTAASDALARTQGLSLALLFGERIRTSVPVNATIAAEMPAEVASQAARARTNGFRCVKLKVGTARTVEEEKERVGAARHALGHDVHLRIDANGAWSEAQALSVIHSLEAYDLEFIEQPIGPGNLEGMRRLQQTSRIPIAADEDVTSLEAAREVLDLGAARVLIVKPMVVGGLGTARRIAELAQRRGASVVVTTTIDSGIGTAAALQVSATLPDSGLAFGLATGELLAGDLIESPLAMSDGEMELPAGPGLGVTLNEAELEQFSAGRDRSWEMP